MNIHKNARLTLLGRAELARRIVMGGQPAGEVARAFHVCGKTARKWAERFRRSGEPSLSDHSSRPRHLRAPTPQAVLDQIITLRRQRFTGKQIARVAGASSATVSRILRRAGLNRLRDLDPAEPVMRYERQNPGELIHLDIKKLGRFERAGHRITGDRRGQSNSRGVGWEFVHVLIDDASRIAFTQIKPEEKAVNAIGFLKAAVAYYKSLDIKIDRVMTDNGSYYKSHACARARKRLRLKHRRTKPYTPRLQTHKNIGLIGVL